MLARGAKPKLTLSVAAAHAGRPALSLKSPLTPLRSPLSPALNSPTAYNTKMNQRGFSTMQPPTYSYTNSSTSRSILKKSKSSQCNGRQLQFSDTPQIRFVAPIEEAEYYGGYKRLSRDERRWLCKA